MRGMSDDIDIVFKDIIQRNVGIGSASHETLMIPSHNLCSHYVLHVPKIYEGFMMLKLKGSGALKLNIGTIGDGFAYL